MCMHVHMRCAHTHVRMGQSQTRLTLAHTPHSYCPMCAPRSDQVLYTTAFSTALSLAAALGTSQLLPSIRFVLRNPESLAWIVALSVASAAVQLVISFTIKRYGAVVFATSELTNQNWPRQAGDGERAHEGAQGCRVGA